MAQQLALQHQTPAWCNTIVMIAEEEIQGVGISHILRDDRPPQQDTIQVDAKVNELCNAVDLTIKDEDDYELTVRLLWEIGEDGEGQYIQPSALVRLTTRERGQLVELALVTNGYVQNIRDDYTSDDQRRRAVALAQRGFAHLKQRRFDVFFPATVADAVAMATVPDRKATHVVASAVTPLPPPQTYVEALERRWRATETLLRTSLVELNKRLLGCWALLPSDAPAQRTRDHLVQYEQAEALVLAQRWAEERAIEWEARLPTILHDLGTSQSLLFLSHPQRYPVARARIEGRLEQVTEDLTMLGDSQLQTAIPTDPEDFARSPVDPRDSFTL